MNIDTVFDYLKNIIEGSLIANALYVNIENNNNTDLSKLTCYFDTPFMLRVLEFKDPEYNKTALELNDNIATRLIKSPTKNFFFSINQQKFPLYPLMLFFRLSEASDTIFLLIFH